MQNEASAHASLLTVRAGAGPPSDPELIRVPNLSK